MAEPRRCRWCTLPLEIDAPEQRIYHQESPSGNNCSKEAAAHKSTMHAKAKEARETVEEGRARRKADKKARPRPAIAPGDKAVWTCPACGPVRGVLYGDDEDFHCSRLECDEVVRILTLEEVAARTPSSWARGKAPPTAEIEERRLASQEIARKKREADASASKEGKEILAGMRSRNDPVAKEAKPMGREKTKVDGRSASARQGKCSKCGETKWLLRKDPSTCARCYSAENSPEKKERKKMAFKGYEWEEISQEDFCRLVDDHGMKKAAIGREVGIHGSQVGHWYRGKATPNHDHQAALRDMLAAADGEKPNESEGRTPTPSTKPKGKKAAKKAKKRAVPGPAKAKRKYQKRKNPPKTDDLAHECRAIEETSRALEGLSPQAIERVLAYTLHRYSQTNGLNAQVIRVPSLLPAPGGPGPA